MFLVEQFRRISSSLPDDWESVRLRLIVDDEHDASRAAALLGPTNPEPGKVINFSTARLGGGVGPERMRALLAGGQRRRVEGELELVGVEEAPDPALTDSGSTSSPTPGRSVDDAAADWSDLTRRSSCSRPTTSRPERSGSGR
jgi:hypothetical protein